MIAAAPIPFLIDFLRPNTRSARTAYVDTQLLQFTDILKAVLGVAGKAGDGLDKDLIDQTPTAVCHHPLEVIPLSHRSSGDPLISIDVNHPPFGLA